MDLQQENFRTTEELLKSIGSGVRSVRINKNIRQEDAAAKAGISLRTLGNLENEGRSTVETLVRVLRALGDPEPLKALAPKPQISPMALLHSPSEPRRVRRKKMAEP